ncbi:MAG: GNAT family N-acetyltransferase [Steroidobacteraceae bacterium]
MDKLPALIAGLNFDLRLLTPADGKAFHTLTNDPKIATVIPFLSYPVAKKITDEWIEKNNGSTARVYGIFSKDGVLMGQVGVHLNEGDEIEVGYWIGSDFKGRGLASASLSLIIDALFKTGTDKAIYAECSPSNQASQRVLEKNGFTATATPGKRPDRFIHIYKGQPYSLKRYA